MDLGYDDTWLSHQTFPGVMKKQTVGKALIMWMERDHLDFLAKKPFLFFWELPKEYLHSLNAYEKPF